jgi:hypothetical protein
LYLYAVVAFGSGGMFLISAAYVWAVLAREQRRRRREP